MKVTFNPTLLTHQLKINYAYGLDPDSDRFDEITKGKTRKDLKDYMSPEKMIIDEEGKKIGIPKPRINLPRFVKRLPANDGIGSGPGDIGDEIGQIGDDGEAGEGDDAGNDPGSHVLEEWTMTEIAEAITEDLVLPNLEPKGQENVKQLNVKWTTISRAGTVLHKKATLKAVLKRLMQEQGPNFNIEDLVPEQEDKRYHSWKEEEKPHANAVIIYKMDVSGSMGEEEKEKARTIAFYVSTVIKYLFGKLNAALRNEIYSNDDFGEGVGEVYIVYDTEAKEVPKKEFFTTMESGGTNISSGYELAEKVIHSRFDPNTWNIYSFNFSDGENWGDDNRIAMEIIERLAKISNEIGFVHIKSSWGGWYSDNFRTEIEKKYGTNDSIVRTTKIDENEPTQYRQVMRDLLSEREKKT